MIPFAFKLAFREGRSSIRRLGVYMGTITLGVAALVAIHSLRAGVLEGVESEAKTLLGADVRLSSGSALPDSVLSLLDSVANAGVDVATLTSTVTVALGGTGAPRLVQLRGVTGGYPFYGERVSDPPGRWAALADARSALVEPAVLVALGIQTGDSIRLGRTWFRVGGTLPALPPEFDFRSAIGPRVYVAGRWLDETGVLQFGSLARYEAYLRMPDTGQQRAFRRALAEVTTRARVRYDSAPEEAEDLTEAIETLGRFLGLVGLMALLLGGLGVASAVHVYVQGKRTTVAVLRCLGATRGTAFSAYLLQAAGLGLLGGLAGVVIGLAVQAALPALLPGVFLIRPAFRVHWVAVLAGLGTGVWVSTVFALLPLLELRRITPLRALRVEVEATESRFDAARILTWIALASTLLLLSVWQAPTRETGIAFAVGLAGALVVLRVAAILLVRITRRVFPRRAAFPVRQGVAGLFRPHNQTVSVTVAIGFGVFLLATLAVVQRNLLGWLEVEDPTARANLVAFDIQPAQRADVEAAFVQYGADAPLFVPIVTARVDAINDSVVTEIARDPGREAQSWALRREYRHTYRAELTESERLLVGEWWDAPREDGSLPRISIEQDVANDLRVGIGDRITWNVQGSRIETRITSLRAVDWARFDTNFYVVFEPGVLEDAPQSFVTVARVEDANARAQVQRRIVLVHPNISTIDLATIQATLERIVGRVALAVRLMAGVGLVAAAIVLFGAIAAARFQRARESALLRTLGATRREIRLILFTEYIALGSLGAFLGVVLGGVAGWLVTTRTFDLPFTLPLLSLCLIWLGVATFTALLGTANSRDALRDTPLEALRLAVE